MAIVNVQSNGVAPKGLSVGDVVKTAGRDYQIVAPGTPGAGYSEKSGYWSVPVSANASDVNSIISQISASNTAKSQASADKQMQYQTESNAKAMEFSAAEAEKNRQWQEQMSNTAHQREVEDLMKAGLNPVLSVMGGSGASTPSGSSASGVTSSGAQAQVDMSTAPALAQIAGALINQKTSNEVAKINADASITTASINAKSAENVQRMIAEQQEYMARFYPQGFAAMIPALFNAFVDGLGGTNTGKASEKTNGIFDWLYNIYRRSGFSGTSGKF